MHLVKRISTVPNSAMKVQIDGPPDGEDGGFQVGGVYRFEPAGTDGDTHQLTEHAARAIMDDPGLAEHFECDPPLSPKPKADPDQTPKPQRKRKTKTKAE